MCGRMCSALGHRLSETTVARGGGVCPGCRRYVHLGHYVPRIEDMRRLIAIQNGHTQRLIEIVGNAAAIKLGLRDLAPRHAAELWNQKYPDAAAPLCAALAGKEDGLEQLRRDKFAGVRMYDLAEYYYKVRDPRSGSPVAVVPPPAGGGGAPARRWRWRPRRSVADGSGVCPAVILHACSDTLTRRPDFPWRRLVRLGRIRAAETQFVQRIVPQLVGFLSGTLGDAADEVDVDT